MLFAGNASHQGEPDSGKRGTTGNAVPVSGSGRRVRMDCQAVLIVRVVTRLLPYLLLQTHAVTHLKKRQADVHEVAVELLLLGSCDLKLILAISCY